MGDVERARKLVMDDTRGSRGMLDSVELVDREVELEQRRPSSLADKGKARQYGLDADEDPGALEDGLSPRWDSDGMEEEDDDDADADDGRGRKRPVEVVDGPDKRRWDDGDGKAGRGSRRDTGEAQSKAGPSGRLGRVLRHRDYWTNAFINLLFIASW
jgi:hypothetical protein